MNSWKLITWSLNIELISHQSILTSTEISLVQKKFVLSNFLLSHHFLVSNEISYFINKYIMKTCHK